MNQFYKVSYEQYKKDIGGDVSLRQEWVDIKLPRRATKMSAGYDFFAPFSFSLEPGESIKFPTGIGVELDSSLFLACYPRSGLGFKHKMHLWNTVGIIDADYQFAENEGHIAVKICNGSDHRIDIEKGQAFMQGIIQQYFITEDDAADRVRTGGFGSTDK